MTRTSPEDAERKSVPARNWGFMDGDGFGDGDMVGEDKGTHVEFGFDVRPAQSLPLSSIRL